METEELFSKLKQYFPNQTDLMRYLHLNACWEYVISKISTKDEDITLKFYLIKRDQNTLEMSIAQPEIKPDLILYFTEKAILSLIDGNPSVEIYYERYRDLMEHPQPGIEIDNKINKPRLKLWQIGYKQWQKDFKF